MRPACHDVPHATMMMRSAAAKRSLLSATPESLYVVVDHAASYAVLDCGGLLEYLFEHEVGVAAFLEPATRRV